MKQIAEKVHRTAFEKGWWAEPVNVPEKLAMVHSEVSEALECWRNLDIETVLIKGKPEGFGAELADIVIRVFDLAEHLRIDIEKEVEQKAAYNETRPWRHGGKICLWAR